MRVVVRMAGEVEEHGAAHPVVGIPGMVGAGVFVAVVADFLPFQAVVFDVVDGFQQDGAKGGGAQEGQEGVGSGHEGHQQHQQGLGGPKAQGEVVGPSAFGALLANAVGADGALEQGARQESVEGFARTGAGGVFRRSHVAVVPVVVLHKKVQVEGGGQQDPGADLVRRLGAVPQFVGYVDAQHAAAQAHAQNKAHAVRKGVGPMPPKHIKKCHQAGNLDGNDGAQCRIEPRVLQRFPFLF